MRFFMLIFCRGYRRDSIVLHYVVRDGQIGQTMGIMRDHDAGWTRLRVEYVRARRYYFVDWSLTLIEILCISINKKVIFSLKQFYLEIIIFFSFLYIDTLLIIHFITLQWISLKNENEWWHINV